jgi:hypothetical protein
MRELGPQAAGVLPPLLPPLSDWTLKWGPTASAVPAEAAGYKDLM